MNSKKVKKRILPGVIIAAFVAALATFFILLQAEKNMLSEYEKEAVWCSSQQLPKGLEITQQNWQQYFVQTEIEKSKVPEKKVTDPQLLIGKLAGLEISRGTVLTDTMFEGDEKYIASMQSPVIAGCKADDLFQFVSGVLRKGDLVHIYAVNEDLGATYLLWENVLVYQVFDTAGNLIPPEDITTPAARVNLLLEKGNAELFYNELQNGSLRVVKVWE